MQVESSAIRAIDYDKARHGLIVRFTSGAAYLYREVDEALFAAFAAAPSKGAFFASRVRDRFAFERLAERG
jgi:hypothetical protein